MATSVNEKLCLKWNNFEDTVSQAFQKLRESGDFFDVTLACEDQYVEAHRSILSSCSPIFHNILKMKPHNQPVIFLRGVTHNILVALMDFMYQGKVSINQDSLAPFLAVGEDLKILGLSGGKQAEEQVDNEFKGDINSTKEDLNWNIIVDIKEELESQKVLTMVEDKTSSEQEKPIQGQEGLAPRGSGERSPRNWLAKFVGKESDGKSHCTICRKVYPRKFSAIDHIENCHFPCMFAYTCDVCKEVKQSRIALQSHKNIYHIKIKSKIKKTPSFSATEEEKHAQLEGKPA